MHADTRRPAPELAACSGVLTLELNTGPAGSVPPGPVSRASATQIAEGIAADLGRLVPDLARFALVVPGALYDQTELLRPGFPLLAALDDVFRGTLLDGGFVPGLVALGSDDGRAFTLPALNPARQPGAGPLLMLPFSLLGRPGDIAGLSAQLENSLLQAGGVSVTTRQAVEAAFGLRAVNLSYATVGDLCALLKVQLEHAGFDGLWELLERALFRPQDPADVSLVPGNRFLMSEGTVWTPFWTFDDWAQIGPGQERPADTLAAGYVEWVRTQRQYLMALSAWGLPVRLAIGEAFTECAGTTMRDLRAGAALDGDYLVETVLRVDNAGPERRLLVTNQFDDEVGTLAYTVAALDADGCLLALEHHYPLSPRGLEAIAARLTERSRDFERIVRHPGGLLIDAAGRCLESAPDPATETATGTRH